MVDASKYWKYIYNRCLNDQDEPIEENEDEENQIFKTHSNELAFFVQLRMVELSEE